jgi:hypothetical protein
VTRGEWIVFLVVGAVVVVALTALFVAVLRDDKDWSDWGREHNDR